MIRATGLAQMACVLHFVSVAIDVGLELIGRRMSARSRQRWLKTAPRLWRSVASVGVPICVLHPARAVCPWRGVVFPSEVQ